VAADLGFVAAVSENNTAVIFRVNYFREEFVIIHPNTQIPWNGTLFSVPAPYCDVEF
jgi:hypothetical protein